MERRPASLGVALLLLAVSAAGALVAHGGDRADRGGFQRLVGGLGFGPGGDLSGCPNGFDPRLERGCGGRCGPVPAGNCFCPLHGGPSLPGSPGRGAE